MIGTTSATATVTCTGAGTPGRDRPRRGARQRRQHAPAGDGRGMRRVSPRTTSATTSTATASTASVATRPIVAGIRPVSNAARLSAANAATSPNGTKTTRVTEKISTSPSPASR